MWRCWRKDACFRKTSDKQGRCSVCNFHRRFHVEEYIFVKKHAHIDYVLDLRFPSYAILVEWWPVDIIVARYDQLTSGKIEQSSGRGRNPSLKTDPSHLTLFYQGKGHVRLTGKSLWLDVDGGCFTDVERVLIMCEGAWGKRVFQRERRTCAN